MTHGYCTLTLRRNCPETWTDLFPDCPCIVFKLFHAECLRPCLQTAALHLGAAVGAAVAVSGHPFLSNNSSNGLPESVLVL